LRDVRGQFLLVSQGFGKHHPRIQKDDRHIRANARRQLQQDGGLRAEGGDQCHLAGDPVRQHTPQQHKRALL
jgi:hypothetical protein